MVSRRCSRSPRHLFASPSMTPSYRETASGIVENEADEGLPAAVGVYVDKPRRSAWLVGTERTNPPRRRTLSDSKVSRLVSISVSTWLDFRRDHLALLAGCPGHQDGGLRFRKNRTVLSRRPIIRRRCWLTLGALLDRGDDRINEGEFYLTE